MFGRLLDFYCRGIRFVMVVCLAVMVILVLGNVVLRYAFNSGLTLSEELSRWLFVWVTFLGAIVAMKEGVHLGSDTLVSRLSIKGQKICFVFSHLLMIFACWLLLEGSWNQVLINFETTSAVMEISMSFFYVCGVVTALSGGLILIYQLWEFSTGNLPDSQLIGIRESEEELIDAPAPLK